MTLPRLAITVGDPAGVGPEICLRLLTSSAALELCSPILFGDVDVLERVAGRLGWQRITGRFRVINPSELAATLSDLPPATPAIVDFKACDGQAVMPGAANAATGRASYAYIEGALQTALAGQVDAVVTGPVNKRAINEAGIPFPGHTELFAEKTSCRRWCMMLTSAQLTCSLVTAHVGYREVPQLLSTERILEVIELSHQAMWRLRARSPRLVVCGLNPHAGEAGLFGVQEEERFIKPAVDAAREKGLQVLGPLPADTAFIERLRRETDCFVCMYHDQGLIPLKALAFETAVNVTLGLPIVRTSVDHGTALDIAWQGKADATSMLEAVKLAARLSSPRTQ